MKPLAIIFNDTHLKPGNEEEILRAFDYMLKYALKNNILTFIFAGDLFHSRSFQRLKVLDTFDKMLSKLNSIGGTVHLFPGNHDKTLYNSFDSFLNIYKHYPSVKFYSKITDIEIKGVKITLLPFFSDDMLVPMIENHKGSDVLISHFEMKGSTNLGNVIEKSNINQKMLKKWKKVYLGHYHNWHEISKNIVHLPSFVQNNFGEDNNKGFSILYDNLSYEIIKGKFKEFNKIIINIEETSSNELKELISIHKNSENTVRFEFYGSESKLKSLDKSRFKGTGIDIKLKYEDKYETNDIKPELIESYDENTILNSFEDFCKNKDYDHKVGLKLLKKFLKQKNEYN